MISHLQLTDSVQKILDALELELGVIPKVLPLEMRKAGYGYVSAFEYNDKDEENGIDIEAVDLLNLNYEPYVNAGVPEILLSKLRDFTVALNGALWAVRNKI